jgi:Zn-dependent M28 family amino/carboxypeptidase
LLDGEDWGKSGDLDYYCLGAKEFARRLDKTKYDYAIVLDMVGDRNQLFYKEGFSERYNPELVEKIWSRAEKIGLQAYFDKRVTEPIYDDHVPLLTTTVKAIDIIDFDYTFWHTSGDTPDKCSAESLDHIGTLMLSLVVDKI